MKKLFLLALCAGTILTACGGDKEGEGEGDSKKSGPTVCDCVEGSQKMSEEMLALDEESSDEEYDKVSEKYEDLMKACDKMADGLSDDEMKELMKEAEECE